MPLILDPESVKKLRRLRRPRRVPSVRPPAAAERVLRQQTEKVWTEAVYPNTEKIKQAIEDRVSLEDLADMLEQMLQQAEFQFGMAAENIIDMWRIAVDEKTRAHINAAFSKSLGIDITAVLDAPEVGNALAIGGLEAANLIKTIPRQFIDQIAKAVADNFKGVPLPENRSLLEQIQHIGQVSKRRARLIARDQTAKMTGLLNQTRQQSLGIETYFWRTSKDQRVVGNPNGVSPEPSKLHGNHWIMEGKMCRWDDPSVYSTDKGKTWKKRTSEMPKDHPAQEIQCRCYSEPVIDVDKIIQHAQAA